MQLFKFPVHILRATHSLRARSSSKSYDQLLIAKPNSKFCDVNPKPSELQTQNASLNSKSFLVLYTSPKSRKCKS